MASADRTIKVTLTADVEQYVAALDRAKDAARALTAALRELNDTPITVAVKRSKETVDDKPKFHMEEPGDPGVLRCGCPKPGPCAL